MYNLKAGVIVDCVEGAFINGVSAFCDYIDEYAGKIAHNTIRDFKERIMFDLVSHGINEQEVAKIVNRHAGGLSDIIDRSFESALNSFRDELEVFTDNMKNEIIQAGENVIEESKEAN